MLFLKPPHDDGSLLTPDLIMSNKASPLEMKPEDMNKKDNTEKLLTFSFIKDSWL